MQATVSEDRIEYPSSETIGVADTQPYACWNYRISNSQC